MFTICVLVFIAALTNLIQLSCLEKHNWKKSSKVCRSEVAWAAAEVWAELQTLWKAESHLPGFPIFCIPWLCLHSSVLSNIRLSPSHVVSCCLPFASFFTSKYLCDHIGSIWISQDVVLHEPEFIKPITSLGNLNSPLLCNVLRFLGTEMWTSLGALWLCRCARVEEDFVYPALLLSILFL